MKRGVTARSFVPLDVLTSIQIAEEVGYETIEMRIAMISSFLAQGNPIEELVAAFETVAVHPNLLGVIENLEYQSLIVRVNVDKKLFPAFHLRDVRDGIRVFI